MMMEFLFTTQLPLFVRGSYAIRLAASGVPTVALGEPSRKH